AGSPATITVTALDILDRPTTLYSGTLHFTCTDIAGVVPDDTTLQQGVGTFTINFHTVGSWSITVQDTADATIQGKSADVSVAAGAATHLRVVSSAGTVAAGSDFSDQVTAVDAFNNLATH